MPAALTDEQFDNYRRDGFVAPIRVLSAQHTADYRAHFEAYENVSGQPAHIKLRQAEK